MALVDIGIDHARAKELARMSQIFNKNPIIYETALQDLTADVKNRNFSKSPGNLPIVSVSLLRRARRTAERRHPAISYKT